PALRAAALPAAAPAARPLAAGGWRHRQRPFGLLYAPGLRRSRREVPDLVAARRHLQPGARGQVSVYSGPEPPSGGVSRPPFAVIAPHWTQFDGVSLTSTVPSSCSSPSSYT